MFRQLTTKQIIGLLIAGIVAVYIVWYVIDALEGLDPNYRPSKEQRPEGGGGKESFGSFDPTKKTPEAVPAK